MGNVLDPALVLRTHLEIPAAGGAEAFFVLGAFVEGEQDILRRLDEPGFADRALEAAAAAETRRLAEAGLTAEEAAYWEAFAVASLYGDPRLHAVAAAPGDPVERVRRYWRTLDLEITPTIPERLPDLDAPASPAPPPPRAATAPSAPAAAPDGLRFFNGCGGFSPDGSEYVIALDGGDGRLRLPPRPWTNVVAGEEFGFLVSETGAGTTWSGNSREHRLTPWFNDPVRDPHGDAFYIRDEATGAFWSPLPGPAPLGSAYVVRHGFGYTTFEHDAGDLRSTVTMFVPSGATVRATRVTVENHGRRERRLSLVAYARLVLGGIPEQTARHIATERDGDLLLARNPRAGEFADRVAFAAAVVEGGGSDVSATADREAFLGPGGSPARPAALSGSRLDGRVGAGLDPCFAHQVLLAVPGGGSRTVTFLLGEETDRDAARRTAARFAADGAPSHELERARAEWRDLLGRVRIDTPAPELDLVFNGWLLYQTLGCRIRARTAFYQSGGAFGFRDQLQDAAALLPYRPELFRRQILLHAANQFVEGDVLHWWHPPAGRGIRTRFADDLLWLPWLTAHYVTTTGDRAILDEQVRFLSARPLADGEDEAFLLPEDSGLAADLYEHCCRALDRSLATGAHGLPLFGAGDWNDGMNRVGREGRGESVWMGFFLVSVIDGFLPLCIEREDRGRAERYAVHRDRLTGALGDAGWDGAWYRRGYYDDGTPLGSSTSDECRIDALVQAWSVISGVASPTRAAAAMDAAESLLVSDRDGIIRLLTPPFENTRHDPGYIKGYVPGVRENGGQYTHAALWFARATAELGRRDRAAALLTMLSPVSHARDPESVAIYEVEPYAIAADVYGAPPHVGRGGWTWYTGSAGWMLRVAMESVLGVRLREGREIRVRPRIPDSWPGFSLTWTLPDSDTPYRIAVIGSGPDVVEATLDGEPVPVLDGEARLPVHHDGAGHAATIRLGRRGSPPA